MAGTITHSWTGTVLTITSDSGTSSADLKGATGNTGTRGPQGPAGVVLNGDGTTGGSGGTVDLSNYYTKAQVDAKIPDTSTFATKTWVEGKGYLTSHQSLDNYATKDYVTGKIAEAQLSGGGGEIDLSGYALKSEIPTVPTKVSAFTNDAGYLTEHQSLKTINGESIVGSGDITISGGSTDLSNYYTKTEIDNKGYLTSHQSLAEYAKKSEIPTKTSQLTNNSGYLTEHQSLKTINGESIVGTGNITISGGSSITPVTVVDNESTDEQIPSAKATYDCVESYVNSNLNSLYTSIESKYTKPSGGIPASDLASGVIPDVSQYQTATQVQTLINNALGVIENGTY